MPVRVLSWLGFLYDLVRRFIYAESTKLDWLIDLLTYTRKLRKAHVKPLAKITGSLNSLHLAFGDVVYLKAKFIQIELGKCKTWHQYVQITKEMKTEMLFWINYLHTGNGSQITDVVASASVTFFDASGFACTAIITPSPDRNPITVNRLFTKEESLNSSTYRELLAVFMGLHEPKELLRDQSIRWFTDSKCVVSVVRSMKKHFLNMALQIFYIIRQYNISLAVTWISRDDNESLTTMTGVLNLFGLTTCQKFWGGQPLTGLLMAEILKPPGSTAGFSGRNVKR